MKFMVKGKGLLMVTNNVHLKAWTDKYGEYIKINDSSTYCWNRTDMTAEAYVQDITARIENAIREAQKAHLDDFVFIIDLNNPYASITGKEK